jgi:hypothetical protein
MSTAFERIVASFDPPMFVVTVFDGHERDGCLIGFATQCSIEPPRFLVCLSVKNRTTRIARSALGGCDWFAGSVLTRHDDLGDHEGFVLDVIEAREADGTDEQLGYQDVKDVDAGHPA